MSVVVRQSTAFETAIGPVLDASGVAVTDCVVGDFKLKKTSGNFAALNGSATLTHVSAGVYDLVLTTSDTDTVGVCCVAIDDTTNACASLYLQVIEEAAYDAIYASGASPATAAGVSAVETDTQDIQTRLPAALGANGNIKADLRDLNASNQSLLDLKDFVDDGYDPSTNKVQGVVLVDTLTTYTGNTPQTADHAASVATILADTNELQTDWANGGRLDLILDARASQTSVDDVPTNAELATALGTADDAVLTQVAAVKAKTDLLADVYHARIHFTRDQSNTQDEYTITWFKNGVRVTSGITSPTIQVIKRADGSDLIASTTPTQVASTGTYKHDATGSARQTIGEAVIVIVTATIDAGTRSFGELISRDST